MLARELGAMRRAGLHPNLVGLLEEYTAGASARERTPVALVLELASGGELFDWIVTNEGAFFS